MEQGAPKKSEIRAKRIDHFFLRRHWLRKIKCFECGQDIEIKWLKRVELVVPICPQCYEKFKECFEETVPSPCEFVERCNLK